MKREEILGTAFTIAISNGWQATRDGKILRMIGRDGKPWSWTGSTAWGSKDLILSHDFANANANAKAEAAKILDAKTEADKIKADAKAEGQAAIKTAQDAAKNGVQTKPFTSTK